LPAFIDLSEVNLIHGVEILLTVGVGLLIGISLINLTTGKIKTLLTKPSMDKRINQISGSIMIAVGLLLGLS